MMAGGGLGAGPTPIRRGGWRCWRLLAPPGDEAVCRRLVVRCAGVWRSAAPLSQDCRLRGLVCASLWPFPARCHPPVQGVSRKRARAP